MRLSYIICLFFQKTILIFFHFPYSTNELLSFCHQAKTVISYPLGRTIFHFGIYGNATKLILKFDRSIIHKIGYFLFGHELLNKIAKLKEHRWQKDDIHIAMGKKWLSFY